MDLKKITRIAMLVAISVVISIIESYIPFLTNIIPGLKLGLSNICIIYVLYKYSAKDAIYVSIIRVFLVGLLRSGLFNITFFFSLSGAIFSILTMIILKKIKIFSLIGISVAGSVMHSIGQILIGVLIINKSLIYYLPYLLLFSLPTGLIVGIITKKILDNMKNM